MNKQKQTGIGLLGLIFVIAVLGSVGFLAMKLVPAYLQQNKVLMTQENVAAQLGANERGRAQLMQDMMKRLQINDLDDVVKRKNVMISNDGGVWQIRVVYERNVPLFKNIDVVMKYDEVVEMSR